MIHTPEEKQWDSIDSYQALSSLLQIQEKIKPSISLKLMNLRRGDGGQMVKTIQRTKIQYKQTKIKLTKKRREGGGVGESRNEIVTNVMLNCLISLHLLRIEQLEITQHHPYFEFQTVRV